MTPEERADSVVRSVYDRGDMPILTRSIAVAIREAEAAATMRERERAAKAVENTVDCGCIVMVGFCECYGANTLTELAAHIRSGDPA